MVKQRMRWEGAESAPGLVPWRGKGRSGTGVFAWCLSEEKWLQLVRQILEITRGCSHSEKLPESSNLEFRHRILHFVMLFFS